MPADASGIGYDPDVYAQTAGQVMHQGQAIAAKVINVRKVMIELTPEIRRQSTFAAYGIPAAGAGIGGVVGSKLGGKSSSGKQIGAILGGVIGGLAGAAVAESFNPALEPRLVPGSEITLLNPKTNGMAVVTQAGAQSFSEGDQVLVVTMGSSVRVIPDNSRSIGAIERGESGASYVDGYHETATEIMKTANTLGLKVDLGKVAMQIEAGPVPNQSYSGKIVGVDKGRGLIYQELGRGDGTVHSASKLNRLPEVGEYVTVQYSAGLGHVNGKKLAQSLQR
jgi:outer membrane lipoprotein SlyB